MCIRYKIDELRPNDDSIIIFKSINSYYPEIGHWYVLLNGIVELYIPANDDKEEISNVEWWSYIPE